MRKVGLGLIGLGTIGKIHLTNCLRLKNAQLLSVADPSKDALRLAKKMGIRNAQADYHTILKDKNIEAVVISVPNFLHGECAINAAEAGKHIFLEKPLARNVSEGEQILRYVKRNGTKLMVGYPLRFAREFEELKNKLDSGGLGDIQMANATNISEGPFSPKGKMGRPAPVPSWWFNKELVGGGALLDLGIHVVSLFKWYFGDVTDARSYLGYRFQMDFEDHALCTLKFKKGPIATVQVGWFSKIPHMSVVLHGTVGHASVIHSRPRAFDIVMDDLLKKLGKTERSLEGYYKELYHFVECIRSDTVLTPSGEEGLEDLKVVSLAYENSFQLRSQTS